MSTTIILTSAIVAAQRGEDSMIMLYRSHERTIRLHHFAFSLLDTASLGGLDDLILALEYTNARIGESPNFIPVPLTLQTLEKKNLLTFTATRSVAHGFRTIHTAHILLDKQLVPTLRIVDREWTYATAEKSDYLSIKILIAVLALVKKQLLEWIHTS